MARSLTEPLVPRWRDSKGYLVLTRFTDKPWHAQDVAEVELPLNATAHHNIYHRGDCDPIH